MLRIQIFKKSTFLTLSVCVVFLQNVTGCDSPCHKKGHNNPKGHSKPLGTTKSKPSIAEIAADFNVTLGPVLDEEEARRMVDALEPWLKKISSMSSNAGWNFSVDMTPENEDISIQASMDFTTFHRTKYWPLYKAFDWRKFKDPSLRRRFRAETMLGSSALDDDRLRSYMELGSNMTKIYSIGKVCDFEDRQKCEKRLDPDLTHIMATSRDPEELKYYWTAWRDASGALMPSQYSEFVTIANEVAHLNGHHDMGEYWRRPYEDPVLPQTLWSIYGQIRPLYEQVHAFVRRRLYNKYGSKHVSLKGAIPAHLLGNMWAQNWFSVWDIVAPYQASENADLANLDVTDALIAQNYTVLSMMESAEKFFTSLGLLPVNPSFWKKSIFTRAPKPRQMVCHAQAFDFNDGVDFRIKMCASVVLRDFQVMHHEMGHIQYYMQYAHQPDSFRDGANPGFHEAIGDTIIMSVGSPTYLQTLGLLPNYEDSQKNKINYLMSQALKLLVDFPWSLILDQWRWDVFCGKINVTQYNCHWWDLRNRLQGIKPPATRSWKDFDPGAKYHVAATVSYERYFVARVLTYQLHEALCKEAGQYSENSDSRPLHLCSIYGSKEAGKKFKSLLQLGSSLPWPEALEKVTGSRRLDAKSVLNYYAPLEKWLKEENRRNGDEPGWEDEPSEALCTPKFPLP